MAKKTEEEKVAPEEVKDPRDEDSEDAKVEWEGLPPAEEATKPEEEKSPVEPQPKSNDELWENYKNLQRKYNKLRKEMKAPAPAPSPSDDRSLEMMLEMAKAKGDESYGGQDPIIARLEIEIAERKRQKRQGELIAYQQQLASEARGKLEDKITDAGLDPEDEQFDDIWEAYDLANALDGKFERAERKLDKALKVVKPTTQELTKETEEEMRKRIEKEVEAKIFKEKGFNVADTGTPAGGSGNLQEIEQKFIEGKISVDKLPPELLAKYT